MSEDETAAFRTLGIAHVTGGVRPARGHSAAALLPLLRRFRAGRKARFVLLALFLLAYSWLTGFSAASLRAVGHVPAGASGAGLESKAGVPVSAGHGHDRGAAAPAAGTQTPPGSFSLFPPWARLPARPGWQRWVERRWPEAHGRFRGQKLRARLSHLAHQAKRGLCVSLAAQLGEPPPTALYFHQLPLYGVAVNCSCCCH